MPIGDIIREIREMRGLSQVELADRIGESKQTIYKYESGVVTNIPMSKIENIARVLNVEPSVLCGWKSHEPSMDEQLAALMGKIMSADDKTKYTVRKVLMLNAEQIAMLDKVVNAMLEG